MSRAIERRNPSIKRKEKMREKEREKERG